MLVKVQTFQDIEEYTQVDGLRTGEGIGKPSDIISIQRSSVQTIEPFKNSRAAVLSYYHVVTLMNDRQFYIDDAGKELLENDG